MTSGTNVVTDRTNSGNLGTTWINSTFQGGAAFRAQNAASPGIGIWGLGTGSGGIGLVGTSAPSLLAVPVTNVGVEGIAGSSAGIAVLGVSAVGSAIPLVAQGASGQTANLQEWQNNSGTPLSVVNGAGKLGVATATPLAGLHVAAGGQRFDTAFVNGPGLQRAINVAVPQAANSITVTLPVAEPDTSYGVSVVPQWNTSVYVTSKTATTFVIGFGTAAPSGGSKLDWIVFR